MTMYSPTNGRMQEVTGEHPKDITVVLKALVRDGLLTQQNQRRRASYRVASDSPQTIDDSPQNSPQTTPGSPRSAAESPRSSTGLPAHLEPLLPLAVAARQNRRLPAARMRALVASLCDNCWLSASEIALLVDRDAEKLQSRFLTAMVREGLLELRYPEVRNRPDQAYRSIPPQ